VRHVRMLGLCLVATLALGAYAVSSASALEWGKCEKLETATGNYTGPNCTKAEKAKPKGTGIYEWRKDAEIAEPVIEGETSSGSILYSSVEHCVIGGESQTITRQACAERGGEREYRGTVDVECATERIYGGIDGPNFGTKNGLKGISLTFRGCNLGGVVPCESPGTNEEPGKIFVGTLSGKLGWLNKSTKEVGVQLESAVKRGVVAHFTCPGVGIASTIGVGNKKEGTAWTSTGCVGPCPGTTPEEEKHGGYDGFISRITPVNVMTSTYTQESKVEEPEGYSYNIPSSFEGKHIEELENRIYEPNSETGREEIGTGSAWDTTGEESTIGWSPKFGESVEIKA
jgi:hypothetical protein